MGAMRHAGMEEGCWAPPSLKLKWASYPASCSVRLSEESRSMLSQVQAHGLFHHLQRSLAVVFLSLEQTWGSRGKAACSAALYGRHRLWVTG